MTKFRDKRRKHQHWQVTVFYRSEGSQQFSRVYTDRERADKFAARQKKSPVVKSVRVVEVNNGA